MALGGTTAPDEQLSVAPLGSGEGWSASLVTCCAGPHDRPYEEQHGWTTVAAVLAGTFSYRTAAGRALMSPGSLLLGERGACFTCGHEHAAGDICVSVQIAPELVEEVAGERKGRGHAGFRCAAIPPVEGLLPVMAGARALVEAPDPLRAEGVALEMIAAALALDGEAETAPVSAADEARVAQAVRLIEGGFAAPLSIAGLARTVGLPRRRFARAFRQSVGTTPYGYILNRRLEAAARLLREGEDPVMEVALAVGFGDLSEFTRRFGAKFGCPPGRYRRARP